MLFYALCALALLFYYLRSRLNFWRDRGIPQNDVWTPMGDLVDVGRRIHFVDKITEMYTKFKHESPVFGFYSLIAPVAMITDLDLVRTIMVKEFNNFVDRGMYFCEEADPLSAHMFNIEGEKWRRIRNSLSPVFTSGKMKGMFHIIEDKANDLVEFLKRSSQKPHGIAVKEANARFTADVVASTAFGLETRALHTENPVILDILKKSFGTDTKFMIKFLFLMNFPKLSAWLRLRQFPVEVQDFFVGTLQETIKYRKEKGLKRSDFMNMLINLQERGTIADSGETNEEGKLSFNEILAQAFLFFVAGYETSSNSMSFAMYFIAKHPEVQNKIREEVRAVKSKHDGKLDYEALMEMTYLNQVFNESLRMFTPVGVHMRKAINDFPIPGTKLAIPAGTLIQIPIHSIHRDPEYFPNPDHFDPGRFTQEEIAKRHSFAFLPFGDGPRNCIGMRFAQLQVKYGLAVVVEHLELSVNPKTIEPLQFDVKDPNMHAKGGLWIDFKAL